MNESPPVLIGERVLWLGSGSGLPKGAKVKWIGRLPEMGPNWAVGIELDDPLPYGGIDGTWGKRKLFDCEHKHGLIVPSDSLITQPLHKIVNAEEGQHHGEGIFLPQTNHHQYPATRSSRRNSEQSIQSTLSTALAVIQNNPQEKIQQYPESSHQLVPRWVALPSYHHHQLQITKEHFRHSEGGKQIQEFERRYLNKLAVLHLTSGGGGEWCKQRKQRRGVVDCTGISIKSVTTVEEEQDEEDRLHELLLERYRIEDVLERAKRMKSGDDWKGEEDTNEKRPNSGGSSISGGGGKRDRSSRIFSIFRWFKRDRSSSVESEDSSSHSPHTSPELLRRPAGSISGSVDTLFSTATANSFAFVPPSYYRPCGAATQAEIRIALGPETSTYRNRIRQRDRLRLLDRNITLREKYKLYGSGTLPRSVDRINEFPTELKESIFHSIESPDSRNSTFGRKKRKAPQPPSIESSFSDKSLPATLELDGNKADDAALKQHRRALSEPVKYVKVPCHVKGKRKAPPPPTLAETTDDDNNKHRQNWTTSGEKTLSLKRKKRQAPPPPGYQVELFNDIENNEQIVDIVREIADQILNEESTANSSAEKLEDINVETASTASTVAIGGVSDIVATDTLRLERGILKPTKMDTPIVEPKFTSPSSPVSPRPWYKRQSTHKEQQHSSKNNERKKDKKKVEDWMLESGFPRRLTTSHVDSKFNIFSKVDKSEEKRKSQISILTNISELDREAAEIIQKGKEMEKALIASHDAMYYTNNVENANGSDTMIIEENEESTEVPRKTSARELISLFNAITNVTKVTVNTSFFSKDGFFKKESVDEKRSSVFIDKPLNECVRTAEVEEIIINNNEQVHQLRNGYGDIQQQHNRILPDLHMTPDVVIIDEDSGASSSSSKGNDGRITKVTIEELDDFDAERNSKAQAMYEAHRLIRHQSPTIPTITEVSENSFKSSPASTLQSTTSAESAVSSEPPSPVQQLAPYAIHKSVVWVCPRCTLENLRWRITCEACDMWRPIPCEFKEQTAKPKKFSAPLVSKTSDKKDTEKIKITEEQPTEEIKETTDKVETFVGISELPINDKINCETIEDNSTKLLEKEPSKKEITATEPSTSSTSPLRQTISSIQNQPLPAIPSSEENNKLDSGDEQQQTEEIRKARLAFFNKNKSKFSREEECQTLPPETRKVEKNMIEKEDDKMKLREMLKEMKHSLPKRPKPKDQNGEKKQDQSQSSVISEESLGAISKIPNIPLKKNKEGKRDTLKDLVIKCEDNEKAEAYLVESETIVEEVHYKKAPEKVSSSVQTSTQVRALPSPHQGSISLLTVNKEVVVPITVEEYKIKDGVLYTSVTKKAKRIGTGTFQLMRPRDFANVEAIKTAGRIPSSNSSLYANVPNNDSTPSTSSFSTNSPSSPNQLSSSGSSDLEKLSFELTKPLGVASFRAGLALKENNNMNTLAVNRLLRRLETAIGGGQHELAAALAKELAQMQISCSVTRQKTETPTGLIPVELFVEDKTSHQGPITIKVRPSMTVLQLKEKMEKEYEIPKKVQRWILGKKLANNDETTLEAMGVDTPGNPIFLYLVAPDTTEAEVRAKQVTAGIHDTIELKEEVINTSNGSQQVHLPHLPVLAEDPAVVPIAVKEKEVINATGTLALGWKCNTCTLVNSPTRPGCAACASVRPIDYAVPQEYVISETEKKRKEMEKQQEIEAIEKEKEEKQLNYQKLMDLEKDDLIICTEEFECPVCLTECEPTIGVVLRECLHVFCRQCLAQTVEFSEEAEVKCPYRDNNYTCDSTLLEREIKALVTGEVYEQHLAKSIALAETKIGNAFHCKTPDCKGWCIYEDNVNIFHCPVCTHDNCLTCQAVHEGLNCKQFQEQLNKESDTNAESRRTKEMLQEMVDRGEAMNCPTCQVILMKKWGCDWLKCSMCKTEICWITRGPRWGPNGKGDTSGGCQCGVNGIKCHPKCTYCH